MFVCVDESTLSFSKSSYMWMGDPRSDICIDEVIENVSPFGGNVLEYSENSSLDSWSSIVRSIVNSVIGAASDYISHHSKICWSVFMRCCRHFIFKDVSTLPSS